MNRAQKEASVAQLRQQFQEARAAVIAEYRGLSVTQSNQLRRALEQTDARFQVVKNTLARRAVEGTEFEALADHFGGPVGVTFVQGDPAAAAKVVFQFAKDHPAFVIRCAGLGGGILDVAQVEALSKLPSREELLGQLVGTVVAPLRNLVGVLSGVPRSFVQVLHAIEQKKAA